MQGVQSPLPEIKMHRVAGASEKSGLSKATIYNRIRDGSLRTVKVCGVRLIPDEALRKLLKPAEELSSDIRKAVEAQRARAPDGKFVKTEEGRGAAARKAAKGEEPGEA